MRRIFSALTVLCNVYKDIMCIKYAHQAIVQGKSKICFGTYFKNASNALRQRKSTIGEAVCRCKKANAAIINATWEVEVSRFLVAPS